MRKIFILLLTVTFVFTLVACGGKESDTPVVEVNPLSDVRVRQALMYGLDRLGFIEAEYGNPELAGLGLAPISPASWAFPDVGDLNPYAFDLEKAGSLLDEAGWELNKDDLREKDGQILELSWLVYTDSTWTQVLSSMAFDSWGQLGVTLNIELMDFNTVSARTMDAPIEEKDFDIYTMGMSLTPDPDPTGGLFDADAFSEGGYNATGFRDERSQELMIQGKSVFGQDERAKIYNEWAILQNELVPTAVVVYRNELWAMNKRVTGMDLGTYSEWQLQTLPNVTLEGDQTLKMGLTGYEGVFNPIMASNIYDAYVWELIFDQLIRPADDGSYYSDLADYTLSEDNLTYTFTIKDGVVFSNGTPMDTKDIEFTFKTIASDEYNGPRTDIVASMVGFEEFKSGATEDFAGINIIDDKTISFTFKIASPANIESFLYGILEDEYYAYETWEDFLALSDKPMGSGRMTLEDWAAKQFISLKTNHNYWNPENRLQFDGVLMQEVSDDTLLAALETGTVDFGQLSTNIDNYNALMASDVLDFSNHLGNGYTFMAFNTVPW